MKLPHREDQLPKKKKYRIEGINFQGIKIFLNALLCVSGELDARSEICQHNG